MPGWLIDLSPLRRHREFRLLYLGQLVSMAGSAITLVALPFQVYEQTRSSLAVGLISLAELVPTLTLALVGGALADAIDRRRLVMITDLGSIAALAVLVANAVRDDPALWVLYVAGALLAGCYALQRPPLDAILPRLVPARDLPAAMALNFLRFDAGGIVAPALGGLLIAGAGLAVTYAVDAVTFALSFLALSRMAPVPPAADADAPSLRSVLEGVRYAGSRKDLLGSYLVDMNAMFFGIPVALFPAVAVGFGGPEVLGLLFSAEAVGAILAGALSGWIGGVSRHGRAIVLAAACYGLAVAAFGLAGPLWLALAFLACAGAADTVSGLFRGLMWNTTIPDQLRGRMAGIEMVSYTSGPLLGGVRAGGVASLSGTRGSIVSGGVACAGGCAVLAFVLPALWRYDAATPARS